MNEVIAKFDCYSAKAGTEETQVGLTAVASGSPENESFSKYTPNGSIQITISNDCEAAEFFKPGKTYFVKFEEAPEE